MNCRWTIIQKVPSTHVDGRSCEGNVQCNSDGEGQMTTKWPKLPFRFRQALGAVWPPNIVQRKYLGRAFLSAVHEHVSTVLARIDAIQAEICEQEHSAAELRMEVREQTKRWFAAHPEKALAISEFFGFPYSS